MSDPSAVLSVDFEFFSHTLAVRQSNSNLPDPTLGKTGVTSLLDIFADHDIKTTFFIVSEVADQTPGLIEQIDSAGHEIGSHTHSHPQLSTLDRDERRDEIEQSRLTLTSLVGQSIDGFRAPVFDFPPDCYQYLSDAGYRYDSSVVPARTIPGFYGGEHSRQRPGPATAFHDLPTSDEQITELPVSVMPWLRLPLSGAWIRLLGLTYTRVGMRLLARQGIVPVLYTHPWEFVDIPPIDGVPKRVYWRTGEWMHNAVERLLSEPFDFTTARSIAQQATEQEFPS